MTNESLVRRGGIRVGWWLAASAALATFATLGCGGDEAGERRAPSMLSRSPAQAGSAGPGPVVGGANHPPEVQSVELSPPSPAPGRSVRAVALVTDEDGDATRLRFVWQTAGGRKLAEGRSFDTTGLDEGEPLALVVTATDGAEQSEPFVHAFQLAQSSVEIALVAIDASEGTKPGSLLEAVVESTDESSGEYDVVYAWKIDGRVVGDEDELDTTPFSPGDAVVLEAHLDFEDRSTRPVRSTPVVLSQGEAPRILSTPEAGIEGGVFRYQVRAASPEPGARIEYELLEGPDGMTVDAASGLVRWSPKQDQRGDFTIEVAARDQWGAANAQSFRIQVEGPAAPPASVR